MRCLKCKVKFEVKTFNQKFCRTNEDCINAEYKFLVDNREKLFTAKCKKDRSDFKKKDKTYTQRVAEAKNIFQKWIRLVRDIGKPCISCGSPDAKLVDGGHYLKAELFSGLIFDERNVNLQCRKCNRFEGGNELNYRDGLIARYGVEYVEGLESIKNENRERTWTDEELESIKKKYRV